MDKLEQNQLISEIKNDFRARQSERKKFDVVWQLCMNFQMGNQYCSVGYNNEIENYDKQYFWQEREVYNHIAPILDIRFAKLQKVKPTLNVIPASNDEKDIKTAKLSKKIIKSIFNKYSMSSLITDATKWSEITGTSFYKITWNNNIGNSILVDEKSVKLGDAEISVCSPFEIYPDSSCNERLEDCQSIIHAKAYHVDEIERLWGVKLNGEEIDVYSLDNASDTLGGFGYYASSSKIINTTKKNQVVLIEKYVRPNASYPNGRLIIVASDTLLYDGELPYINGEDGKRDFPFIKQTCDTQAGCFWGVGIVERLIPVQRAYNAVKNRKHEYLNRVSMGVLTVEDGSVDLDNLEEEGLSPGKVLVYRQGSTPPSFMDSSHVPADFEKEEEALLSEFMLVSGVSDILSKTESYQNLSGVSLQLLIEQDDSRITTASEKIKDAIIDCAKQILRIYKQFATIPRMFKFVDNGSDLEIIYFSSSDISSDDVVFEADAELSETLAQRRSMVFELLKNGLLHDEDGKLTNRMRVKALELLGFGIWDNSHDLSELHMRRASNENSKLSNGEQILAKEIDDHNLHINEHISFMLGNDFEEKLLKNPSLEDIFIKHIQMHKKFKEM